MRKTTVPQELSRRIRAVYLRADTIEQAMRDWGMTDEEIGGMGYGIGYSIATENLRLGMSVVADTVNPIRVTREAWRAAAEAAGCPFLEVELFCGDPAVHQARVVDRSADISGFSLPTWEDVIGREYEPWKEDILRIDTASRSSSETVQEILSRLPS